MRHVRTTTSPANGQNSLGLRLSSRSLPPGILRYLAASLKRQWKRYRRGLKRCQQNFSEKAVHESRVETRRLLSILELLGSFLTPGRLKEAQTALKRHLDTFDDLRDTQVQLPAVKNLAREFPAAALFLGYLEKREDRFTRQTRKRVKGIPTRRLSKLISACRNDVKKHRDGFPPNKANALMLRTVDYAFNRTLQLRKQIDPATTETIHRTRVSFKKFRYMIETLAQHLPLATEKLLTAMRRYQTLMGEIQDAEVLLQSFEKYARKKEVRPQAARIFRQELLRWRRRLIRVYLAGSGQLLEFWPGPQISARAAPQNGPARASAPAGTAQLADSRPFRTPASAPKGDGKKL